MEKHWIPLKTVQIISVNVSNTSYFKCVCVCLFFVFFFGSAYSDSMDISMETHTNAFLVLSLSYEL